MSFTQVFFQARTMLVLCSNGAALVCDDSGSSRRHPSLSPVMGSRQRSLLAWLASFGGPLAGVSGDHDAAWEPLEDGRLLLGLLLCLDKDADFGQEHESFITTTVRRLVGLHSKAP